LPAGEWSQVRIVAKGPRIEITLNCEKIVDRNVDRCARSFGIGLELLRARSAATSSG